GEGKMADRAGQQLGNYRLLRLLGRGGFADVYLGEHVYLNKPAAIKVLHHGVASLIDKSLLQQTEQEGGEPRLAMLETIREYGRECLEALGEAEFMYHAHAAFYLALAEETEPRLTGAGKGRWLERLQREHENL